MTEQFMCGGDAAFLLNTWIICASHILSNRRKEGWMNNS